LGHSELNFLRWAPSKLADFGWRSRETLGRGFSAARRPNGTFRGALERPSRRACGAEKGRASRVFWHWQDTGAGPPPAAHSPAAEADSNPEKCRPRASPTPPGAGQAGGVDGGVLGRLPADLAARRWWMAPDDPQQESPAALLRRAPTRLQTRRGGTSVCLRRRGGETGSCRPRWATPRCLSPFRGRSAPAPLPPCRVHIGTS